MPLKGTPTPGLSIQSLINFGKKFYRISRTWIITQTWFLARLFVYLSSFISQILEFLFWLFVSVIFDDMTVKTQISKAQENQYPSLKSSSNLDTHAQVTEHLLACWGSLPNRPYTFCQTHAAEDGTFYVVFPHLTPSRVSGAFRSLRACLRAPEKLQKKKRVCWGPVSPRATNSVNT